MHNMSIYRISIHTVYEYMQKTEIYAENKNIFRISIYAEYQYMQC